VDLVKVTEIGHLHFQVRDVKNGNRWWTARFSPDQGKWHIENRKGRVVHPDEMTAARVKKEILAYVEENYAWMWPGAWIGTSEVGIGNELENVCRDGVSALLNGVRWACPSVQAKGYRPSWEGEKCWKRRGGVMTEIVKGGDHWGWCQYCSAMIHRGPVVYGVQHWFNSQGTVSCGDVIHQPWLVTDFADMYWSEDQVREQLGGNRKKTVLQRISARLRPWILLRECGFGAHISKMCFLRDW
jgi:hypothetical protein